jgi:hypothetical protein
MRSLILILSSLFVFQAWESELTALWPTLIEIVNITETHGGPEPNSFSERISDEAIRKWNEFKSNQSLIQADGLNDAFFRYQSRMYERTDSTTVFGNSTAEKPEGMVTWPELQSLPEYQKMRYYIAKFGKRYLERLGYDTSKKGFNIFSWAAVHSHSDYHGPHTHTGELLVGVYYARVTRTSGRLRLFDPRGTVPPFGKSYDFSCQTGQMIFFPSWLQHAALTTKIDPEENDGYRVIFAFNIGIGGGRGEMQPLDWHKDPVSSYQFTQRLPITSSVNMLPLDVNSTECVETATARIEL